ncbi:MAG: Ig-like domain-containing protein, partial [Muribaculaceae bacterium]|nr:Ig-like domain-containing protein [Muribaculaceae bacterium]
MKIRNNISCRLIVALAMLIGALHAVWAADSFYAQSTNIEPGESKMLAFCLDNSQVFYGFQAEINLPEGLQIVLVNDKANLKLADRTDSSFSLVSNLLSENAVKVGAFSTNRTPISGDSGVLLYLNVKAAEDFTGGDVTITEAMFTDASNNDVILPDSSIAISPVHDNNFYIPDFKIAVGESKEVSLILDNETSFTAFQTDIYLPKGLEITPYSPSLTSRGADHTISLKFIEDGHLRLVCMSTNNTPFSGNSGALVNLQITATNDVAASCNIELKDQRFTMANAKEYIVPNSTTSVTTERAYVESIILDQSSVELHAGETIQISNEVLPNYASTKELEWSSTHPSIATVSATGLIKAIAVGTSTVTASAIDGSGVTATCQVTVLPTPIESITLNSPSLSLTEGDTATLTATIAPADATDKSVTWSSSDESVVTVSANGEVTAVNAGTATITATSSNGKTASCTVTVADKIIDAAEIELSESSAELKVGEATTLTATVLPENTTDKTVTWSSSNMSVATVDANGKIIAVALGEATITATCGNVKATCKVTVVPTPVTSVTLSTHSLSLTEGETATLSATIAPEDATDKTVTWTSSDEAVATVSEDGVVTAVKGGTATITATSANGKTADCTVTVAANIISVESIEISNTELRLTEGDTATLTATIAPENATDKTVIWTSSDASVAYVSEEGVVTAVKAGTATITAASSNGKTATCTVTVAANIISVESISISESVLSLTEGETATLTATIAPENATDKSVTWTSSDEAVTTVSVDGVVTAIKAGTATITVASSNGKTATCKVTVAANVIEVIGITLSNTNLSLTEGETATLTATIAPENATDKSVTWTSSDEAVASVSDKGVVTAVKAGTATITATSANGKTATCTVTVAANIISVESIAISKTEISLTEGDTATLTATIAPENATDKTVSWTSSDEAVATVSADGVVTAVKAGTATITVASSNGKTATCKVTVAAKIIEVTGITLDKTELSMTEGDTGNLTATIAPENATDKTVTWTSSDATVASVSNKGVVTAVKAGTA